MNFLSVIHQNLLANSDRLSVAEVTATHIRSHSIAELNRRVSEFQATLLQNTFKENDRVILWAKNSFDWVAADLAILFLGGVTIPVFSRQTFEDIEYIAQDSQARFLLLDSMEQFPKNKGAHHLSGSHAFRRSSGGG